MQEIKLSNGLGAVVSEEYCNVPYFKDENEFVSCPICGSVVPATTIHCPRCNYCIACDHGI